MSAQMRKANRQQATGVLSQELKTLVALNVEQCLKRLHAVAPAQSGATHNTKGAGNDENNDFWGSSGFAFCYTWYHLLLAWISMSVCMGDRWRLKPIPWSANLGLHVP
eukprot:scaffold29395_cov41-Prasinocladus_malaysianus.AAC.1